MSRASAGVRRITRARRAYVLCAVFFCAAAAVSAQSLELEHGANGIGVGVFGDVLHPSMLEIGNTLGLSIGGTMDIGAYVSRQGESVASDDGTNIALGFLYTIMPIRQQPGVPFSMQLKLTYGLVLVDPIIVAAELRDLFDERAEPGAVSEGTRTVYTLGFGLSHEFRSDRTVAFRIGLDAVYRVQHSAYATTLVPDTDDPADEEPTLFEFARRRMTVLYGPSVGLTVRSPLGPAFSFVTRVLLDDELNVSVRPELSVVLYRYE